MTNSYIILILMNRRIWCKRTIKMILHFLIKYIASTGFKRKKNQVGLDFPKSLKVKLLHWLRDTKQFNNLVVHFENTSKTLCCNFGSTNSFRINCRNLHLIDVDKQYLDIRYLSHQMPAVGIFWWNRQHRNTTAVPGI